MFVPFVQVDHLPAESTWFSDLEFVTCSRRSGNSGEDSLQAKSTAESCKSSVETGFAPACNNTCTSSLDAFDLTASSRHD